MKKLFLIVMLVAAALLLRGRTVEAEADGVDLEIVLAVDASGSVDEGEFRLQLQGIAEAFRDPVIHRAILSGQRQRIAVAMVIWADSAFPKIATDWYVIETPEASTAFGNLVEHFHAKTGRSKGIGGGGTSIGDAVAYSIAMIEENGISATRRVIDVSGDGIETDPWAAPAVMLPEARTMAAERGIVVNGLAILNDYRRLNKYYQNNVIVGEGSFVMDALDYEDFKRAIREKLWREIAVFIG